VCCRKADKPSTCSHRSITYASSLSPRAIASAFELLLATRGNPSIPDEQIRVTVACRAAASRIVAGLREHTSQLHVMSDDPTNTAQWERRVGPEWDAIAWPEHERDAPMLTDLFEGLT